MDWHPWGEAGSTLLVMTVDGKLREYDVSLDPEEPSKTVDFVPEKKRGAFIAQDDSEREVASFIFGKGKADWGPLTIYALMRSGDVYAVCPYLPTHAYVQIAKAVRASVADLLVQIGSIFVLACTGVLYFSQKGICT